MKRKRVILFAGLILMFILVGCGAKSQEDVLKDLNSKVESMNGYKLDATMTLTMGTEAQEYKIEVWHNKPENYRVHMKNAEREQSQMILRNKDGVYVLTPALNKSFKFQSEWPKIVANLIYLNRLLKIYMKMMKRNLRKRKPLCI